MSFALASASNGIELELELEWSYDDKAIILDDTLTTYYTRTKHEYYENTGV